MLQWLISSTVKKTYVMTAASKYAEVIKFYSFKIFPYKQMLFKLSFHCYLVSYHVFFTCFLCFFFWFLLFQEIIFVFRRYIVVSLDEKV